MFSFNEFYKSYNARSEGRYQELKEALKKQLGEMNVTSDKGFRERMMKFSRACLEHLLALADLEEKESEEYRNYASLRELKEDNELLFKSLSLEGYAQSSLSMMNMFQQARDVGPVLSMFASEFVRGAQDALEHRRFRLADKMQLYMEMHKKLVKGQVKADPLITLYKDHVKSQYELMKSLEIQKQFFAGLSYETEIVKGSSLTEPYYLYNLHKAVGETELGYYETFKNITDEVLDKAANALVEGFMTGFAQEKESQTGSFRVREQRNESEPQIERKAVAIDYPLGMELLVKKVMEKLEEKGYLPFIRRISTQAVCDLFRREHAGDEIRFMDAEMEKFMDETDEKLAEMNRYLIRGYAGAITIDTYRNGPVPMPDNRMRGHGGKPQRLGGRYSVRALEEKASEKSLRSLKIMQNACENSDLYKMSSCRMVLPVYRNTEDYTEEVVKYMTLSEKRIYGLKPQQVITDAMDKGSFIHLQGKGGNKTDLMLKIPAAPAGDNMTAFKQNSSDGTLPGGSIKFKPLMEETKGTIHIPEFAAYGMTWKELVFTVEDGMITSCECDGFESEELMKKAIRDKFFRGNDMVPLAEFVLGTNTAAYEDVIAFGGPVGLLAPSVREVLMIGLRIGSAEETSEEDLRWNNAVRRKVRSICASDEKAEAAKPKDEAKSKDETKPEEKTEEILKETSEPADNAQETAEVKSAQAEETQKTQMNTEPMQKARKGAPVDLLLSVPYGEIGTVSVVHEDGSRTDIMRNGLFVPIGLDRLNMPLMHINLNQ